MKIRMHDSGVVNWRQTIEKHHAALIDELAVAVDSGVTHAVDLAKRTLSESLNQALRRVRQAENGEALLHTVTSESAPFCTQSVVLLVDSSQLRAVSSRGMNANGISFDAADAAAIAHCAESADLVIALPNATELSEPLAAAFSAEDHAHLFPIAARQITRAILVAQGRVQSAPLELLCQSAGMRFESLADLTATSAPATAADLIQIGNAKTKQTWSDLSAEDQQLHLKAQRTARLRVAQLRLDHERALRQAAFSGTIYEALRAAIDPARDEFRTHYIAKSPTMVDYLHLEILRSLAHDDEKLLGNDYPGPLA